jgi:hypothetical protein
MQQYFFAGRPINAGEAFRGGLSPVSIYRPVRQFDPAAAEVSDFAVVPARARAGPVAVDSDPGAERWGHLRRNMPVDTLLSATVRWAARLPEPVRPYALMRDYPRVANRIAGSASSPAALAECLADLLIDRRGGRRGFPAAVAQDLLRLRAYVEHLEALARAGGKIAR